MINKSFLLAWPTLRLALLVTGSVAFIFLMVSMTMVGRAGILDNDLSAYLAPAVAIVRGTGAPYVNFFDIKPPGLVFFFVPWIAVFGWSLRSLIVLDVLLLSGNLLLFFYLLRRVASPLLRDVVYGVSVIVAFGLQLFGGMFLISETIGSFLLLLAIAIALRFRFRPQAFLVIGALCALSGQIKEAWIFCIIPFGVLAVLDRPTRWRSLACLAAGWVAVMGLIVGSLVADGALGAYVDVLHYKATLFPLPGFVPAAKAFAKDVVSESVSVFFLWPMLPVVVGISLCFRVRVLGVTAALRELVRFKDSVLLISFATWVCLMVGYVWQAKPVQGHAFVILFFPFLWLTASGLVYVHHAFSDSNRGLLASRGLAAIMIGSILIPSTTVIGGLGDRYRELRQSDQISPLLALEDAASLHMYSVISSHLTGTRCLQVAYGWNSGAAYVYTGANPCSRYFLANLLTDDVVDAEFRSDMTSKPPDVIVYATDMANLDVQSFEKSVFPYTQVLAWCYTPSDTPTVFVARYGPADQSVCIGHQLSLAGLRSSR